ncbi:MAG: LPS export ABC transporter permease LptF [Pseudomonadota bacterium]
MTAIGRYILRQLALVALFVTVTLTLAVWLAQSLRFIELIVNRGLSLSSYFYLTMLLVPSFLSILLPVALFAAVLFTYHKLIADSEIVVLRSIGLGPWRLAAPALVLAGLVVSIGYALSLHFLPLSYREFKDLEFDFRHDYSAVLLREGVFNNVSDGITVYIRSREADGELFGIIVHDNRAKEKPVTIMAERGMLTATEDGPRVIMIHGNRQQVDREGGKLALLYFDRYSVDLGGAGRGDGPRWREPRERFLSELISPADTPAGSLLARRMRVEVHNRLLSPLYAFAFTAIGLAALMSGDFNRRGQARRVMVAVALVVVAQTLAVGAGNLAMRFPLLTGLVYMNVLAAIAVPLYWLQRTPKRRRLPPASAWTPA